MIIVFKSNATQEDVKKVTSIVEEKGLTTHIVVGKDVTICGIIGDTTRLIQNKLKFHLSLKK